MTSEIGKPITGERRVLIWQRLPNQTENHWLDCAVGCTVAASICGARLGKAPIERRVTRRTLAERQARARERRNRR